MADLDLSTDTDVDSVRATAAGLSGIGNGIDGAVTGFGGAVGLSAQLWQGSAAEAFRSRMTNVRQAAEQAVSAARRMSGALSTFADQMATVHATIDRARAVATAAGLHVNGNTISEPSAPPAPPAGCYTPAAAAAVAQQEAAAQARYVKQLRAFAQARELLNQARKLEGTAHQYVSKAASEDQSVLDDLNKNKYWLTSGALSSAVAGGLEQRTAWQRRTQELGLDYDRLRTAAASTEDPAARVALRTEAQDTLERAAKAADATVGNARLGLGVDPASGAGRVLDHLPDALAGAQAVVDIAQAHGTTGKVVAGTADALGYGAGEAVTAGGTALLEGLAIGGAPETFGLSLLAGGVAYGVGTAVQHYGPAVYDWTSHAVSNVAGSVAGAVTHPGRTLDDLGNDIGSLL